MTQEQKPPQGNKSAVARLLQQIHAEYEAASRGLEGLAQGTSQHAFITAKLENIEASREQLVELVGDPDEATRLVVEQMNISDEAKAEKSKEEP